MKKKNNNEFLRIENYREVVEQKIEDLKVGSS